MDLFMCICVGIIPVIAEAFIVHGSSAPLFAPLGSSVVLPCYVDEHLLMKDLRVEWRRTDSETLVHLYQDGESRPEAQHKDYHDRAHFFTDQIQHGNFSLRLDNLRAEDEGRYTCRVHSQQDSGETVVQIKHGFSSWHIAVLFFCFAAGSGAVLLLCSLIYYRSKNTVTSSIIMNLQVSLVFCPNICLFFAFMLWGFTEGSLHETVTCCALCILRPVMLMWALHYLKNHQDNHKSWVRFFRITHELTVLTVIVYSGA
ncbi:myelin-oligodendrocyte glycoprotein-like [Carassius gibelio]|uniref:myelin-oligodendrocyte glycoprotein-like n=1 Tax=Carassius gibelio TaxID=101364 RepID=UPI002277880B|nr:myelin-oligodendrocyte glycoprotein-like [Carassius gibelio]